MTEWLQLVNTHPGFPKRNPNHPAGIFDVVTLVLAIHLHQNLLGRRGPTHFGSVNELKPWAA